jgi:predicted ferric reductase
MLSYRDVKDIAMRRSERKKIPMKPWQVACMTLALVFLVAFIGLVIFMAAEENSTELVAFFTAFSALLAIVFCFAPLIGEQSERKKYRENLIEYWIEHKELPTE